MEDKHLMKRISNLKVLTLPRQKSEIKEAVRKHNDGVRAGRPKDWFSIPDRRKMFFPSREGKDQLWGPTSLLTRVYRGSFL
jgi:hypothetical protein